MRKYIINPFTGLLDCIGIDNPTPPTGEYIVFADPEVERICIENWSSDGIGLTYPDAEAVTDLAYVFAGNSLIQYFNELVLFTGLQSLSNSSFTHTSSLKEITLPNSINEIGMNAFDNSNISSIIIPNSVTKLCEAVFRGCPKLTSITIPDSVTVIPIQAFSGCNLLHSIILPKYLTDIRGGAFNNCPSLQTIDIPNSVIIFDSSFEYCELLNSITIEAIIPPTTEGNITFEGCNQLAAIYVPAESVDTYKAAAGWNLYANIITAIVE